MARSFARVSRPTLGLPPSFVWSISSNNTIGTLRQILDCGVRDYAARTGRKFENPATGLARARVKQKELQLPEPDQFRRLLETVRRSSGGWGPRAADLIEFLAYSGLRVGSEARWITWQDIDWQRKELIVRGDPETGTKNSEIRRVPIIQDLERLLERLRREPDLEAVEHLRWNLTVFREQTDLLGGPGVFMDNLQALAPRRLLGVV